MQLILDRLVALDYIEADADLAIWRLTDAGRAEMRKPRLEALVE